MRTSMLLILALILLGCGTKKGDPAQVTTYIEALKSKELEARITAVENLVRVGKPAIGPLEKNYSAGYGKLTKELLAYLKPGGKRVSVLELQLVADEKLQSQEWRNKRLQKVNYQVLAGYEWAPLDRRMQPTFGGRSELLLVIGKRRWVDRTLLELKLTRAGGKASVSFTMQTPLVKPFSVFTGANQGKRLAVRLRGNVVSAPVIQSRIEGAGMVSGLNENEVALVLGIFRSRK